MMVLFEQDDEYITLYLQHMRQFNTYVILHDFLQLSFHFTKDICWKNSWIMIGSSYSTDTCIKIITFHFHWNKYHLIFTIA